jgi:hypothetical protein
MTHLAAAGLSVIHLGGSIPASPGLARKMIASTSLICAGAQQM